MRTKLAASCACAEKTFGLLVCCGGGRVAWRIIGSAADTTATPEKYRPIRSAVDRIAPAGCAALKGGSCGLLERASTSSSQCLDAGRARRRFHACGACARAPARLPANHAGPNHPAGRNGGDLLPEHSFLRTADLALSRKRGSRAAQIQKVSAQVEVSRSSPQVVT